jgi:hypothetical protein
MGHTEGMRISFCFRGKEIDGQVDMGFWLAFVGLMIRRGGVLSTGIGNRMVTATDDTYTLDS